MFEITWQLVVNGRVPMERQYTSLSLAQRQGSEYGRGLLVICGMQMPKYDYRVAEAR